MSQFRPFVAQLPNNPGSVANSRAEFLLARSEDRRAKELALHEKFTLRMEAGLKKMQAAAVAGRLNDESVAGERLRRLKQQN